jgi:hypothetical protein
MKRRKWIGNYVCRFCPSHETINHLFFTCPLAAYMWSTICEVLGVFNRPSWFTQYFWWIAKILPVGFNLHIVGIAALCWPVWKTRNKACFENKLISSPVSLICYMCAFLCYWAGLQVERDRQILLEGADRLQRGATSAHDATRTSSIQIRQIQDQEEEEEVDVVGD